MLRKAAGEYFFLWCAFILSLQPAFAAAIFVSISFSVKGAPIRDTCQTNLIEEGFEGFSTVRYSYLAVSTGSCRDQVDPTLCHGEKLRFEEKYHAVFRGRFSTLRICRCFASTASRR